MYLVLSSNYTSLFVREDLVGILFRTPTLNFPEEKESPHTTNREVIASYFFKKY